MKTLTLQVAGMTCSGCSRSITDSLSGMTGVADVSADHLTGQVLVRFDETLSADDVKDAIDELGFDVVSSV